MPQAWRGLVSFRRLREADQDLRGHRKAIPEFERGFQTDIPSPFDRHKGGILGDRRTRRHAPVPTREDAFAFHEPRHGPDVGHQGRFVLFESSQRPIQGLEHARLGLPRLDHRVDPLEERHPERQAFVIGPKPRVRRERLDLGHHSRAPTGGEMEDRVDQRLAEIANTLADVYLEMRRERHVGEAQKAYAASAAPIEEREAAIRFAAVLPTEYDRLDGGVSTVDVRF